MERVKRVSKVFAGHGGEKRRDKRRKPREEVKNGKIKKKKKYVFVEKAVNIKKGKTSSGGEAGVVAQKVARGAPLYTC